MNNILHQNFLENSLLAWLSAVLVSAVLFFVIRILKSVFIRRARMWAQKTSSDWDDYIISTISNALIPMLYIGSVYLAVRSLTLSETVESVVRIALLVSLTFFVLRMLSSAFRKFVLSFIGTQENSEAKQKQASGLILIINIIIWIFGGIFLMDNLGYNVTSIIAGLGIGGIAIALAAQTILGDLFSYFVIFFDRPFEIGDFIIVDDKSGTVEYIGIKTTRLRTLGGEQLVCSNSDLTDARLHNYKRLKQRRIRFNLGFTYQTTHAQLARIPEMLKSIINSKQQVRFDRAHFSAFGDFSLNFEIVYYVLDADFAFHMDRQHEIYLDIYKQFGDAGIEFAYPTQTVFMQQDAG